MFMIIYPGQLTMLCHHYNTINITTVLLFWTIFCMLLVTDKYSIASYLLCLLSMRNTRMWANAQRDGRSAKYRWRPLFNTTKFG